MDDPSDLFQLSPSDLAYAKSLRDQGLDDQEIASEVRWRRDIGMKVLIGPRKFPSKDSGPGQQLQIELQNALQAKADLQRRLSEVEAQRDQALAAHKKDKLAGKSRTTFLKVAFVVGQLMGFVPGTPNGAVTKIRKVLEDYDIEAEDDEALRNVLKEAAAQKSGGFWQKVRC